MSLSKEEYLKRYLSGPEKSDEKKKKKRKAKSESKAKNLRIFDDDVDLRVMDASDPSKTLEDELPDEAPTVAEVVDERPEEIVRLEAYRASDRWKQVGADRKGRKRHDSSGSEGSLVARRRHDSDSDASPVRTANQRHDSDSDQSPARKHRQRHDSSDSDQSVSRKVRHDSSASDQSPPRKRNDSDQSPPRRDRSKTSNYDSDHSPPRRKSRTNDEPRRKSSDVKRNRAVTQGSDSDASPPRKHKQRSPDSSPVRRKKSRQDSDQDQSPPRKNNRRRLADADPSPPRRDRRRPGAEADASPPRRKKSRWAERSPERSGSKGNVQGHDSEEEEVVERDELGRRKKTLGGAKAGLSTGRDVKTEIEAKRKKEDDMFKQLNEDVLGKNAKTVFRDKKSGRRRNMAVEASQEAEDARVKAERDANLKAKYDNWGKGLAQQEERGQQVEAAVHEAAKPLARFKDDEDLDEMLRHREREDDPMLEYVKKKKSQTTQAKTKKLPRYSGPQPPMNRFGLWPGYRWDGVDRSNGFEKKLFTEKANRKALENIKYKWSTEDM